MPDGHTMAALYSDKAAQLLSKKWRSTSIYKFCYESNYGHLLERHNTFIAWYSDHSHEFRAHLCQPAAALFHPLLAYNWCSACWFIAEMEIERGVKVGTWTWRQKRLWWHDQYLTFLYWEQQCINWPQWEQSGTSLVHTSKNINPTKVDGQFQNWRTIWENEI